MSPAANPLGPIGRLGRLAATHRRAVFLTWAVIAVGLGVLAPRVETALSGAGWQANGSESVKVREQIERDFGGVGAYALQVVVHSESLAAGDPAFERTVSRVERHPRRRPGGARRDRPAARASRSPPTATPRSSSAPPPRARTRWSPPPTTSSPKSPPLPAPGTEVNLTGASGMWSDFNDANRDAMLKSELISWPVTMAILVLAFGSLVAAGLPLMLTIVGLIASAGVLYLGTQALADLDLGDELRADVRARAGHRLRAVRRRALPRRPLRPAPRPGRRGRRDDGHRRQGGPLLRPDRAGLAVGGDAGAEPRLPLESRWASSSRSLFVLAATLTLLPAVLAKLGPRIDRLALPWVHSGEHRSARFARWGERLWRRPVPLRRPAPWSSWSCWRCRCLA